MGQLVPGLVVLDGMWGSGCAEPLLVCLERGRAGRLHATCVDVEQALCTAALYTHGYGAAAADVDVWFG